jgi:hypothetical protein
VTSAPSTKPNRARAAATMRSIAPAEKSDGVPPPT